MDRMLLEKFFIIFLAIQILHSIEELSTGFHKKFPLMKMSFHFFLTFEILFTAFWVIVLFMPISPARVALMAFFNLLMFANGTWHIVWFWFFEKGKRYIPGLITAFLHIIAFGAFYGLLLR